MWLGSNQICIFWGVEIFFNGLCYLSLTRHHPLLHFKTKHWKKRQYPWRRLSILIPPPPKWCCYLFTLASAPIRFRQIPITKLASPQRKHCIRIVRLPVCSAHDTRHVTFWDVTRTTARHMACYDPTGVRGTAEGRGANSCKGEKMDSSIKVIVCFWLNIELNITEHKTNIKPWQ